MHSQDLILVVDDSPTQLEQMRILLESEGFEVATAESGERALDLVDIKLPSVVVTDLQMPGMNGLELVERLKADTPSLPVVLTTSQGSEDIAAQALQKGAASYVPKRDMNNMLGETVRRIIGVVKVERQKRTIAKYTVENAVTLSLINDETLVPSVIARLEQAIVELNLFDESERVQIAMALDEALLNAIVHGNLEVSSDLREIDNGKPYFELIAKRQYEEPFSQRRVNVRLQASADEAMFVIRDEGPGFDASILCDPTDPENLEKAGGRGLYLINAFMDKVTHNDTGNEIVMIKHKPSANGDDS